MHVVMDSEFMQTFSFTSCSDNKLKRWEVEVKKVEELEELERKLEVVQRKQVDMHVVMQELVQNVQLVLVEKQLVVLPESVVLGYGYCDCFCIWF